MGEKIGITLYFYSREASFKCILEEEQRVVWREFFSLRQVKRSFQAKFSFSLVQPKPNVWADLAIKIPHAFGGTVLLTHLLDGVCVQQEVVLQCAVAVVVHVVVAAGAAAVVVQIGKNRVFMTNLLRPSLQIKTFKKNSSNWFTND